MLYKDQTLIIAEAGVNHNGSLELAYQLIDAATEAGANIVKFQTFRAEDIATPDLERAHYQKENCKEDETQYEMLKRLELPREVYPQLIQRCKKKNIEFMSSIFDHNDTSFLASLKMPYFKVPSGEITNGPLLLEVAKTQSKIILSTGMATLGEIEQALMVIAFGYIYPEEKPSLKAFQQTWQQEKAHKVISEKVILLHCTSDYPTPLENVHLRAMDTLAHAFNVKVGYSDHTEGIAASIAAVARGAKVIEKHFTLDKELPGPDHRASLNSIELKQMVHSIRQVEKMLGSSIKHRTSREEETASLVRKTLVAKKDIQQGRMFNEGNTHPQRARGGASAMTYWERIGTRTQKPLKKGEIIA